MRPFLERLKSRKFIMAVVAGVIGCIKVFYPDFPEDALYAIVGALMGYVAIEGVVDACGALAKWGLEKRGGTIPEKGVDKQ